MSSRKVTLLTSVVICSAVLAFAAVKSKTWRQSRQINREIDWIQDAVQQIQKSPAPAPELIQSASTGRWEIAGSPGSYLIFSNGWAACRTHSWHRNDGLDDIAVMRMPNGNFYLSRYHFESGIAVETLSQRAKAAGSDTRDGNGTYPIFGGQPADAKDFLNNGARWQGWYLFSRDGKLQCIVRSPHEDNGRDAKGLWVWIGVVEGAAKKTLFQKKYSILAGRDMVWTSNWTSDDEIVLDVFDYGDASPMMMGEDLPARSLAALIFERDKQSGMFLEKTNILRLIVKPQ